MRNLFFWILAVLLLAANTNVTAETSPAPATAMRFGMDSGSIDAQTEAGVRPDHGTMWIGPWTLTSGWSGPGNSLSKMKQADITPAIHFYYWGDDISPSCVEDGCWSSLHNTHKDQDGWQELAQQLVDNLKSRMGGEPVMVFMETEFNKNGIEDYAPFDHYLAQKARFIKNHYPAAEIVLAFGNWDRVHWANFDQAAAASDAIGIQGMRGSTRDPLSGYRSLYEDTVHGVERMQQLFAKPVVILDVALSSYPEPDYLHHQAEVLENFFLGLDRLHQLGVEAIIYRTWYDSPDKSTANYYGVAERHWGLDWDKSSGPKPSGEVWMAGVQAARNGEPYQSPLSSEPRRFEVSFDLAKNANEWWVETYAAGTNPLDGVEARIGGGKWNTLKATDWGTWANSFHAPRGSQMVLQATDLHGNTAASFPFAWLEEKPRFDDSAYRDASATFSATAKGLTAQFDASGSSDPYDRTLAYTWDFGDGTAAAAGTTPVHDYVQSGTYHVTLTVDNGAVANSTTRSIQVHAPPPVAAFATRTEGLLTHLDATASHDPEGRRLDHTWDLGDGTLATGPLVDHEYAWSGTYTVTLTVDNGEETSNTTGVVKASAPPPVAAFDASVDGLDATLDAAASSDAYDRPLAYRWDLGAGAHAEGPRIEHRYPKSGTYSATLTVDNGEATSTSNRNITVQAPPPEAAFTAAAEGLTVRLDASGSSDPGGRPLTHRWDLADGTTRTGESITHTYKEAGTYTVTLVVDNGEHAAQRSQAVTVEAPAPEPLEATFRVSKNVNEWWIEVFVDADKPLAKVQARVDDGSWRTLTLSDWGAWVASFHVPKGSQVVFRATDTEGQQATGETHTWLGTGEKEPASGSDDQDAGPTFRLAKGVNEWWVEVFVDADQPLAKVQARVDDGSWRSLTLRDWGAWAASFHVPKGSQVVFHATDIHGQQTQSGTYTWLVSDQPEPQPAPEPDPDPTPLQARFDVAKGVNEWWVEVFVDANKPLVKVQARVDDGSWRTLTLRDWGAWAASFHVPNGSQVAFRAVDTDGESVESQRIAWS